LLLLLLGGLYGVLRLYYPCAEGLLESSWLAQAKPDKQLMQLVSDIWMGVEEG
jgi:hypothetical protein